MIDKSQLDQELLQYFNNVIEIRNNFELYKMKDNQEIITNITNMRDKFFAHSDRKYFKMPKVFKDNSIKNEELEDLIKNIYKFVKTIYANLHPIMLIDWVEERKTNGIA